MPDKKIKVLHVISSFGMGGAETWLLRLLKYWVANSSGNVEFHFLASSGDVGVLDNEVTSMGAKIYYLPFDKKHVFSFVKDFRNLLAEERYDAIHDHQDFLSGWHFLFGWGMLPPVRVAHVHNPSYQIKENYGISTRRRMQQRMGKLLLQRFATHIGGTSKQVLDEYGITKNAFPKQWIGAVHCAFSIEDWSGNHRQHKEQLCVELGISHNSKIILFVGRLDSSLDESHPKNHKNSVFALNVFEKLADETAIMIMAGANDYIFNDFDALIRNKSLSQRVLLLGIQREIARFMLAADVLFFPSRAEGLGMVAVEAQAAGLPVLASTAVPKECVVIPELVQFMDLSKSHSEWAATLKDILQEGRHNSTQLDSRWNETDFSLVVSADKLLELYKGNLN